MALLTTVVGHTTMTTSRILVVSDQPGRQVRLAYSVDGGAPQTLEQKLVPAEPYGTALFELKGLDGGAVTYGAADYPQAEPAPDAGALLANPAAKTYRLQPEGPPRVALVSCNDIQSHQFPKEQRGAMWRRLGKLVQQGEVDLIVHAGDQIYGDGDPTGWKPEQGRAAAYRQHYVENWRHPDVAAVLGSCPNVMMWDDHEIYDGYGSNDNDVTEKAQERFQCASQAFKEFQSQLNPRTQLAGGFGWLARYGDVAIMAVDGRSNRRWSSGTILGTPQLESIEAELGKLNGVRHLLVVVGTPVVFIPLIAAEKLAGVFGSGGLDDIRDGWTSTNNREECRRFLMRLLNFAAHSPETMVTILGGDIHIGSLAQIDTTLEFGPVGAKRRPRLYQVTSSGIARPAPSGIAATFLAAIMNGGAQDLFNTDIQGALLRINGSGHPHCITHRNFAILDPRNGKGELDEFGNLRVRFHTETPGSGVFEQLLAKL